MIEPIQKRLTPFPRRCASCSSYKSHPTQGVNRAVQHKTSQTEAPASVVTPWPSPPRPPQKRKGALANFSARIGTYVWKSQSRKASSRVLSIFPRGTRKETKLITRSKTQHTHSFNKLDAEHQTGQSGALRKHTLTVGKIETCGFGLHGCVL